MIREAVATVDVVPACAVFVRGSLEPFRAAVATMWVVLWRFMRGHGPMRCRRGAQTEWHELPDDLNEAIALLNRADDGPGCRWLEVSVEVGRPGVHIEVADLLPVSGRERASYIHIRYPKEVAPIEIVQFGEWAIQHLPLLWGAAGMVFVHVDGPRFTACGRIAALAKRYLGVQIQDTTTMQWDALRGMPGINWLTLVGTEFAELNSMPLPTLVADALTLVEQGVFHRQGRHGLMLAAGPRPLLGDVNMGEDLGAYAHVARLMQPALLKDPTPLGGPLQRSDVLTAWIRRFEQPTGWLDVDLAAD